MDDVTRGAQLVGKRQHALREPLRMVEEQYLGHQSVKSAA